MLRCIDGKERNSPRGLPTSQGHAGVPDSLLRASETRLAAQVAGQGCGLGRTSTTYLRDSWQPLRRVATVASAHSETRTSSRTIASHFWANSFRMYQHIAPISLTTAFPVRVQVSGRWSIGGGSGAVPCAKLLIHTVRFRFQLNESFTACQSVNHILGAGSQCQPVKDPSHKPDISFCRRADT